MNYPATFELRATDELTGIPTAAYFRHLLRETLLPQAEAGGEPLSVCLMDGDGFEPLNRSYGRACGDAVIKSVVRTLQELVPESAVLSRYGGDEIAAALPERLDDAFTLLEEFRRRVADLRFEECPEAHITWTIGLAAYPAHARTEAELMRAVDEALYLAKATGRNKVSMPLADARMITKTSHYTGTQLERLANLSRTVKRNEASLLREALDDLLKKYNDRLS
jgi:diguanylate cyclase (GGDEF)-like protein